MIPCKRCNLMFVKSCWNQLFCSEECSAKYSNDGRPRVKRSKEAEICPTCKVNKKNHLARQCHACFEHDRFQKGLDRTIEHMILHRGNSSTFIRVVHHARYILSKQDTRKKVCAKCNNWLGLDVKHLWPIDRFPRAASLRVVNNPDNIEWRCRWHR